METYQNSQKNEPSFMPINSMVNWTGLFGLTIPRMGWTVISKSFVPRSIENLLISC